MPLFAKEILAGAIFLGTILVILLIAATIIHYAPQVFTFLLLVGLCWGIGTILVDD